MNQQLFEQGPKFEDNISVTSSSEKYIIEKLVEDMIKLKEQNKNLLDKLTKLETEVISLKEKKNDFVYTQLYGFPLTVSIPYNVGYTHTKN